MQFIFVSNQVKFTLHAELEIKIKVNLYIYLNDEKKNYFLN